MSTDVEPESRQPGDREVGLDGGLSEALVRSRRFFTRAEVSDDLRTLHQIGGRGADDFYRDRWSHDKVVRSTHGVNCTGSCSWKVYVKDGIITWETQQTDYPSVGPDRPEYEPRGCPRGAAFSWYTYSPTRVRYPYARGVLVEMYREAKARTTATRWRRGRTSSTTRSAPAYQSARGKGGLVRVSWDEAIEMVAAAHVHTIKKYGPDRVAGFSPIPAMSMVSHAVGARFISLIGGAMLSFYDWYADLPVASPQVFGDQTDVPESGDWWDAAYLIMWGSNVPGHPHPGRALDGRGALPRAEGRRGRPGLRRQREVRRRVAARPARHRRRAGDGDGPRHPRGVLRRPADAALRRLREALHRPAVPGDARRPRRRDVPAGQVPHRGRPRPPTATRRTRSSRPSLLDARTDEPVVPNGSLGHRYGETGVGRWNLDLGDVDPELSLADASGGRRARAAAALRHRRRRRRRTLRAACRSRRVGRAPGHHRLRPDARPVRGRRGPGCPASGRPATTTPRRRTPRPGRSRSPASRPRPRRGSPGSSPTTPSSPAAGR